MGLKGKNVTCPVRSPKRVNAPGPPVSAGTGEHTAALHVEKLVRGSRVTKAEFELEPCRKVLSRRPARHELLKKQSKGPNEKL